MIFFPNAKINFGLNVIEKRPDGYHNLETLFYPLNLCDILEVVPNPHGVEHKVTFQNTGLAIDCTPDKNLVTKAYCLLDKLYNLPPVIIHLHKVIPFGGGLGGGSSDGAFMVKAMNELFNLKLTREKMEQFASELGSDCAFFINNKPSLAFEKGQILHSVEPFLKGYFLALIIPPVGVNTAQAYQGITPRTPLISIEKAYMITPLEWKNIIFNDFEVTVFKIHPLLAGLKDKMYQMGAVYASMSGSGSSIYGIFKEEPDLGYFKSSGYFTWSENLM